MKIKKQLKSDEGFTLIEVLVSLVLFSIGLLGVALQFGNEIRNRVDVEIHSSIMQIAMQAVEPLHNALSTNNAALFQIELNNLNINSTPAFVTNNSNLANYAITIATAIDSNPIATGGPNNLLVTDVTLWQAPYNVVLHITYTGRDGVILTFPTTHAFTL